jgi:hypothetical protein
MTASLFATEGGRYMSAVMRLLPSAEATQHPLAADGGQRDDAAPRLKRPAGPLSRRITKEAAMKQSVRRFSYFSLCSLPFLAGVVGSMRPLRTAGVHQVIGGLLFTVVAIAAWSAGAREIFERAGPRKLALAGGLFILPWAIISLLWVGIGPPFQATLSENYMRYLVLVSNSILVTSAFIVLKDALYEIGERFYATIGFAASLAAGGAYLVCLNMSLAYVAVAMGGDKTPPPAILGTLYSSLEFFACLMTYVTTGIFAVALGQARLLGRGPTRAYLIACGILVLLLVMRGLQFPEISANTAPWYTRPGVIAGIPAVPWIMPCLLGAVLLRRAGDAAGMAVVQTRQAGGREVGV